MPTDLTVGETLEAARIAWSPKLDRPDIQRGRELARFATNDRFGAAASTLSTAASFCSPALMRKPTVLLLDEPCSGLMQDEIDEMDAIIRQVTAETGIVVIVAEHRQAAPRRGGDGARSWTQGR